ncbi:MAG TPA: GntR family transcriptional regulator [Bryobacteraceae bacterium]|nr:GntR family transcriptional regulator [Bryobacteraceae bacterium]
MVKSTIETDSPTSIRLQLSQILRREISEGRFESGARIPSERDLAGRYGISRASVRESITELIEAGILFRTVGKGTFVSAERPVSVTPAHTKQEGICFAISEGVFHFVQTGYNRILAGVEAECRRAGLRLYFQSFGDASGSKADSIATLPSGCVVVGGISRHVLDSFRENAIPYVLVDLLIAEDNADHLAVRIDYAAGTRAAMTHLHGLGHRSFGFVGFPGSERYRAYWQKLEEYGIPYDPRQVEFLSGLDLQPGMVAGFDAMQRMIAERSVPTSLIVVNDFVALGVMQQLKISGYRVPEDISVIGFDDLGIKTSPPLTTVRVDLQQVGRLAAKALFRKLNGETVENNAYVVPVDLMVRGSTAAPRQLLTIEPLTNRFGPKLPSESDEG